MAGPNMMCSVYAHLNIFNFLITATPILLKFDMMYLWDKGDINCEFQVSYPHEAGRKVSKLTNLKKIF
jgi:hypothetical protein